MQVCTHFSHMYLNRIMQRLDHWVDVFRDDYESKQFTDSLGTELSDQLKVLAKLFDNDVIGLGEYCYLSAEAAEYCARLVGDHVAEGSYV